MAETIFLSRDVSATTGSQKGTLGQFELPSLQPGDRGRTEVRCHIYVRADRGNKTATKIYIAADLLLPAVFSFSGDGATT